MNVTLSLKENSTSKDVKALQFENKVLIKELKVLAKNVNKLEKIKEAQIRERNNINDLQTQNKELKATGNNLQVRARELMKELVV